MRESTKMIKSMAMENSTGSQEITTKASIKMTKEMVMVKCIL